MADEAVAAIEAAERELVAATEALTAATTAHVAARDRAATALEETQRLYRAHQDANPDLPLYEWVDGRLCRLPQEQVEAILAGWQANKEAIAEARRQAEDKARADREAADAAFEAAVRAQVARMKAQGEL